MIMNGKSPTLISGVPSLASVDATAKVQAATRPSPPPMAWPFTRAMTGFVVRQSAEQ